MVQSFTLGGENHFLARVTVQGANGASLSTNWIAPVVMSTTGGLDVGSYGDVRALWIPFDNDAWVSYNALPIANSGTSFEAAAFYDNASRNGVVVGSVTHDTWKSGVYYSGSNNKLDALNVFGRAVDPTWTHDPLPHGMVTGSAIASPIMFVGYAADWRDLLEEYADTNLPFQTELPWDGGVPFGWNSWGELQSNISYDAAVGVSDYIANNLQTAGFSNEGTVYINLDSYWDNLSSAQFAAFVAHCHTNGQKAGITGRRSSIGARRRRVRSKGRRIRTARSGCGTRAETRSRSMAPTRSNPTHPGTKGRITLHRHVQEPGLRIHQARLSQSPAPSRAPSAPTPASRPAFRRTTRECSTSSPNRGDDVHQRVDLHRSFRSGMRTGVALVRHLRGCRRLDERRVRAQFGLLRLVDERPALPFQRP